MNSGGTQHCEVVYNKPSSLNLVCINRHSDSVSRVSYGQPYTRTSLRGPIISQAHYGISLLQRGLRTV